MESSDTIYTKNAKINDPIRCLFTSDAIRIID